jgi:transposase
MKIKQIVGIDVSKLTLDCHHYLGSNGDLNIPNNPKGFKTLKKFIQKQVGKDVSTVMVLMEHTGYYSYNLESFLHKQNIPYTKKPALDIKRSCGMVRGKTDKADARMISKYGLMRKDELKVCRPLSDSQLDLQQLMAHRDKLVADKTSYHTRAKELGMQLKNKFSAHVKTSTEHIIQTLAIEIKQTEAAIKELIKENEALERNYILINSVTGIGFATAVHFLIATENFSRFNDHRQFACYCGVAPFEHSSGTSVRGKTKTSSLANRKIKSLLTMAAISAIQHDEDLKEKYQQKLKQGKPKMSALNIIRAKLIERIFTVIKRQSVSLLSD